jgi:uncharacterized protein (TIGR03066 family)
VCSVVFSNCADNDDDTIEKSAYSEQIVGKWAFNYRWFNFKNDGALIYETLGHVDKPLTYHGDWSISGDKLTLEIRYDDYIEPKEYTIRKMKSDEMLWYDSKSGSEIPLKRVENNFNLE